MTTQILIIHLLRFNTDLNCFSSWKAFEIQSFRCSVLQIPLYLNVPFSIQSEWQTAIAQKISFLNYHSGQINVIINSIHNNRAVFKWLSKIITWLRLLRLVIGLKESRRFFNQWEAKPKPMAPCTRDFSRASSELQVIARNCDWFIVLFVPVVIGRSTCFGFGFLTVIWKPLSRQLICFPDSGSLVV